VRWGNGREFVVGLREWVYRMVGRKVYTRLGRDNDYR